MSRKTVFTTALLCTLTIGSGVVLIDNKTASAQQPKADAFTLTVPGFAEAALLKVRNASNDPGCGGENVSPPVQWSHAPAETKSFAVTITDPDGQKGFGLCIGWPTASPRRSALSRRAPAHRRQRTS